MASSSRMGSSRLGDSWVVQHNDGSEASSEGEEPQRPRPIRKPAKIDRSDEGVMTSSLRSPGPRRRSSRASTAVPEPELIMPSIRESTADGSWIATNGLREDNSRARRRSSRTNTPSLSESTRNGRKAGNGSLTAPANMGSVKGVNRADMKTSKHLAKGNQSDILEGIWEVVGNIAEWTFDILGAALKTLKKPISLVLAIYVFAGLITLVQNLLTSSVYSALSPLCRIPGASLLNLPMCHSCAASLGGKGAAAPVEFDELMTVQSHFEEILEQSAAGTSLPLDMKRSETSIRDLRQIVRHSQLSSRNELVLEFDGFIETARTASYDLQRFNSHVGRSVDNVLATARWTERVLDDLAIKQSSRGLIPSFINDKLLAPFQPIQFTETKLLDQYILHTGIVAEEIERLIEEAQALLLVLQNLEDRLEIMHNIALRDNIKAQGDKDEVLSQLWTLLGGNRAVLGKYNHQLRLLRQVGEYRRVAWAHVSGTILKLQAMGTELEELRERVGSAELLRDRVEVPLAVHIESIRLGVKRLEQGRETSIEVSKRHINRVLDKGQDSDMRLVLDG